MTRDEARSRLRLAQEMVERGRPGDRIVKVAAFRLTKKGDVDRRRKPFEGVGVVNFTRLGVLDDEFPVVTWGEAVRDVSFTLEGPIDPEVAKVLTGEDQ